MQITWTVRIRLVALSVVGVLVAAGIALSGYLGLSRVDAAMDDIVHDAAGARDLAALDQLHDAFRGDVYRALAIAEGKDAAQRQALLDGLAEHVKEAQDHLAKFRRVDLPPGVKQALVAVEAPLGAYLEGARRMATLAFEDRAGAATKLGEFEAAFTHLESALGKLSDLMGEETKRAQGVGDAAVRGAQWLMGTILVVAVFALGSIAAVITRSIVRPLGRTVDLLRDVAEGEGDLTKRLDDASRDEIGEMARWFNTFMDKLHAIIVQVRQSADHAAVAAQQLSGAAEQLSGGTQEQASSLEETAASLEEITGTVKQNADNARQANQLAVGSRDTAEKGGHVVGAAVSAMAEINRSSKQIAAIITTIDEIAFQTNLLALNAAVEAARAGDQGRGFAVVAAEVRNLAQRSATAAKEIKGLIQDSVAKVEAGSELVSRSGQTLEEIVTAVKKATDVIAEIAAASQEQTQGIDQVNRAVTQMDQVVQGNAAQTEELSSTAQALAGQAQQLQALVGRFKLGNETGSTVAMAPVAAVAPAKAAKATPARRVVRPAPQGATPAVLAAVHGENGSTHARDGGFEEF